MADLAERIKKRWEEVVYKERGPALPFDLLTKIIEEYVPPEAPASDINAVRERHEFVKSFRNLTEELDTYIEEHPGLFSHSYWNFVHRTIAAVEEVADEAEEWLNRAPCSTSVFEVANHTPWVGHEKLRGVWRKHCQRFKDVRVHAPRLNSSERGASS